MPFQLQDLYRIRNRILNEGDVPLEEVTEMVTFLRADRQAKLSQEKPKKTKKESTPKVDVEKLLSSVIG